MKAEESAFYPALMEKKEAREDAMEGIEEHHVSELVLKELEINSNLLQKPQAGVYNSNVKDLRFMVLVQPDKSITE